MRKKLGVIALMLSGIAGVAFAQNGYYGYRQYDHRYYYRQNDRNWNRHERREWKERRREERRDRQWREHERRERRFDRPRFYYDYRR
jgi:hypothetical protein